MVQVSSEEAKERLSDLIAEAAKGEVVLIEQNNVIVQLTLIRNGKKRRRRQPGSAKGLFAVSDDFDAPLTEEATNLKSDPILSVLGIFSGEPITNEEIDEELYGPVYVKDEASGE